MVKRKKFPKIKNKVYMSEMLKNRHFNVIGFQRFQSSKMAFGMSAGFQSFYIKFVCIGALALAVAFAAKSA